MPIAILPIAEAPADALEALLDAAFGADRRTRTAYRLRDGVAAVPGLSFAAFDGERLVGSLQSWPVELAGDDGRIAPLLLVGPVAVAPERQRGGIGRALMTHALAAIDRSDETCAVLIGDPEYYGRRFGFSADATRRWRLPGPVERHRLLARATGGRTPPTDGTLRPRAAIHPEQELR